jgi:hypothetical protein
MATGFSSTPPFNAVVHVAVDDATRLAYPRTNGKAERFIQTLLTNLAGNYN